ncbi:MAG: hypothetical protein ACJ746_24860 [Bryobacteraceae bacterium]
MAKYELIQINLELITAHPVVSTEQPLLEVANCAVCQVAGKRQKLVEGDGWDSGLRPETLSTSNYRSSPTRSVRRAVGFVLTAQGLVIVISQTGAEAAFQRRHFKQETIAGVALRTPSSHQAPQSAFMQKTCHDLLRAGDS